MKSACLLEEAMSSDDDISSDVITISKELVSATMKSACLLEEAMSSDDDISSDVITISTFCLRAKGSVDGFNEEPVAGKTHVSQAFHDQRLDNQLQAYLHQLVNQSQATVYPVAGYSVLHIQSIGNSDAGKADVVKSCKPVDKESRRKEVEGNNQMQSFSGDLLFNVQEPELLPRKISLKLSTNSPPNPSASPAQGETQQKLLENSNLSRYLTIQLKSKLIQLTAYGRELNPISTTISRINQLKSKLKMIINHILKSSKETEKLSAGILNSARTLQPLRAPSTRRIRSADLYQSKDLKEMSSAPQSRSKQGLKATVKVNYSDLNITPNLIPSHYTRSASPRLYARATTKRRRLGVSLQNKQISRHRLAREHPDLVKSEIHEPYRSRVHPAQEKYDQLSYKLTTTNSFHPKLRQLPALIRTVRPHQLAPKLILTTSTASLSKSAPSAQSIQNIYKLNPAYTHAGNPELFTFKLLSPKQLAEEDSFKPMKKFSLDHVYCVSSQPRPRHCTSLGMKTQLSFRTNRSWPQQITLPDRSLLHISSRSTISFFFPAQLARSDQALSVICLLNPGHQQVPNLNTDYYASRPAIISEPRLIIATWFSSQTQHS
ncbi:hypothetical protein F511_12657 [Dorcoceras hygrometricum]|uniref:Uncharacterized protein n=1 Tax=Dorcoceras hygrometricum TaxID=472368 RepID=A0A2Z7C8U7_9LAMI|nr:hypothetical protein F511_12657 [Dorcoceras hygrometricum]